MKQTYNCKILKQDVLNDEVYKILLEKPDMMPEVYPGQFFSISASSNGYPLLRRPISISRVDDDALEFTIKLMGSGTQLIKDTKIGETLDLLGPLGNGFILDNMTTNSIIVGGGIGIAPVKELARVMKRELNESIPVLLGFRDEPYDIEDFSKMSSDIKIATESGVSGVKGFVTTILKEKLDIKKPDMVYVCGPHVMLKAVSELCNQYGVETQLLMEERMACGIGACLVCTCAIKDKGSIKNKRVCKDGPVFYGSEVAFNE